MSMRILIANMRKSSYRIQKQPPEVSYKRGVFKTFANLTRKNRCCSLFLVNLIKKRLQHSCFAVKLAKILRTSNLKNICERLLLRKLQEELLNSTPRVLHFNKCLQTFQIFYPGQYIPAWYTPKNHERCIIIMYDDSANKERIKQFSLSVKINWTKKWIFSISTT